VTVALPDATVLGAGPVGLIAALRLAQAKRNVVVRTRRLPAPSDPARVDRVPAAFLSLLVELGISPLRVGADKLHGTHSSAWGSPELAVQSGPKTAHVERPALDLALLGATLRCPRIVVDLEPVPASGHCLPAADDGGLIIDASGRAAVTAQSRVGLARPLVARTFLLDRHSRTPSELAVAALPDGYAYRLAGASSICIGVVGRGKALLGAPPLTQAYLHEHAGFLLRGLPPLSDMAPGASGPASVQCTEGNRHLRIGDAALARDALSSQGLATGASEALYAAAVNDRADLALLQLRQAEQRQAHLRTLAHMIEANRFSQAPLWRTYAGFIRGAIADEQMSATAALRDGRIVPTTSGHAAAI
jgi:hypothetical protein